MPQLLPLASHVLTGAPREPSAAQQVPGRVRKFTRELLEAKMVVCLKALPPLDATALAKKGVDIIFVHSDSGEEAGNVVISTLQVRACAPCSS